MDNNKQYALYYGIKEYKYHLNGKINNIKIQIEIKMDGRMQ